jgi:hypothetical protein
VIRAGASAAGTSPDQVGKDAASLEATSALKKLKLEMKPVRGAGLGHSDVRPDDFSQRELLAG